MKNFNKSVSVVQKIKDGATFRQLSQESPSDLEHLQQEAPELFQKLAEAYDKPIRTGATSGGQADWSLRDWEQKDTSGLKELMASDPARYAVLFEKAYGHKLTESEVKSLIV